METPVHRRSRTGPRATPRFSQRTPLSARRAQVSSEAPLSVRRECQLRRLPRCRQPSLAGFMPRTPPPAMPPFIASAASASCRLPTPEWQQQARAAFVAVSTRRNVAFIRRYALCPPCTGATEYFVLFLADRVFFLPSFSSSASRLYVCRSATEGHGECRFSRRAPFCYNRSSPPPCLFAEQ